jgi:hypothetical protein
MVVSSGLLRCKLLADTHNILMGVVTAADEAAAFDGILGRADLPISEQDWRAWSDAETLLAFAIESFTAERRRQVKVGELTYGCIKFGLVGFRRLIGGSRFGLCFE